MVGHEIELRAGTGLKLRGAFRAGKVVADAERAVLEFIDRGESLAVVRSLRAGDDHALGLAAGIEPVSAPVGFLSDEHFLFTVVQFEADHLQDSIRHGLSGQLSLEGLPISLNFFGVIGRVASERAQ